MVNISDGPVSAICAGDLANTFLTLASGYDIVIGASYYKIL